MNLPTDKKYSIIYADPGWQYKDKANAGKRGAEHKYKCMSVQDICDLPVKDITAENAILFLWVTKPFIFEAEKVIKAWGFEYKTNGFTWIKKNKIADSFFWGMGNWTRSNPEDCLLAVKGKPKRLSAKVHSVVYSPIRAHSQKPDEVRDKIVQLVGDLPRIELFSRQRAPGWDRWGNEV